jgi:hypothetical protein
MELKELACGYTRGEEISGDCPGKRRQYFERRIGSHGTLCPARTDSLPGPDPSSNTGEVVGELLDPEQAHARP